MRELGADTSLACDHCSADSPQLREINKGECYAQVICAACFPGTSEAAECEFRDFPTAQEASE